MARINLGCGNRPRQGFVNIDIRRDVKPDLVCDIVQGLVFADNSIDEVSALDFLEHIPQPFVVKVIEDIWRVLKPGGRFESLTPSTDGRGAFQDPTHASFWNINSWLYFTHDGYRELIATNARFKGDVRDIITDNAMRIIHTHAVLEAVK